MTSRLRVFLKVAPLEARSPGNGMMSNADRERLKADLPHVAILFTPRPEEKRGIIENRRSDVCLFHSLLPVLQRLNALPSKK